MTAFLTYEIRFHSISVLLISICMYHLKLISNLLSILLTYKIWFDQENYISII